MPGRREKRSVNSFLRLDLADLSEDWFARDQRGQIHFSDSNGNASLVRFTLRTNLVELEFAAHGVARKQTIRCCFTDQRLGGKRRWFVCPGCSRRCRVLYGDQAFLCRECVSANYPSQYASIRGPGLAAANRALKRLGTISESAEVFPEKPPRMHWCTYYKLQKEFSDGREAYEHALFERLGKFLS